MYPCCKKGVIEKRGVAAFSTPCRWLCMCECLASRMCCRLCSCRQGRYTSRAAHGAGLRPAQQVCCVSKPRKAQGGDWSWGSSYISCTSSTELLEVHWDCWRCIFVRKRYASLFRPLHGCWATGQAITAEATAWDACLPTGKLASVCTSRRAWLHQLASPCNSCPSVVAG